MDEKKFKEIFRSIASIMIMGAAIALSAEFCSFMATNQLIAGLLAGAFGYEPMKKLLGKVKGLK